MIVTPSFSVITVVPSFSVMAMNEEPVATALNVGAEEGAPTLAVTPVALPESAGAADGPA